MAKGYLDYATHIRAILSSEGQHAATRRVLRFTGVSSVSDDGIDATEVEASNPSTLSEASVRAALQAAASVIDVNGQKITNVGAPTATRANVATALYAETLVAGIETDAEAYADAGDAGTLQDAENDTDSEFDGVETYIDAEDLNVLEDSEDYTDSLDPSVPLSSKAFTSSGSWVCPANVTSAFVLAWGGGGQGGGASRVGGVGGSYGGGGGGGAKRRWFQIHPTPGQTYTVTLGAGGTGGGQAGAAIPSDGTAGANGSNTTMTGTGVSITAYGGSGGSPGLQSNPASQPGVWLNLSGLSGSSTPGMGGSTTGNGLQQDSFSGGLAGADGIDSGAGERGRGGGGGGAGPGGAGGKGGAGGNNGLNVGAAGTAGAANTGAGGGGGGGSGNDGASAAISGAGAAGGSGYLEIIWRVS
jgi:hypothetical protein